ncbi:hypothetical protein [Streptomyces sp. NPDC047046]|uniref:hypothetical protein n=1 Tax=Streptomyces sp. NPDC047046 TaxID=3155378 RepID=UPI0034011E59
MTPRLVPSRTTLRKGYTRLRVARERLSDRERARPARDDWPRITPAHLSLLDGRTLNVSLAVPADVPAVTARLSLGESTPALIPLRLREDSDGTVRAEGTAVIELLDGLRERNHLPAGIPRFLLGAGAWKVSVLLSTVDGTTSSFALAGPGPLLADGPTRPDPAREDGTHCRLTESLTGRAHLLVGRDAPAAEVERVETGWTAVTVRGRLLNAPADAYTGGHLSLVARATKQTATVPLMWHDDRFTAVVSPEDLPGITERDQIWDLRLLCTGLNGLRPNRLRGDVRDPATVHRMPARVLADAAGRSLRLYPYYTSAGSLALKGAYLPGGEI